MSDSIYVAKKKLEIFWFTAEKQKTKRLESSAVYIMIILITLFNIQLKFHGSK